MPGFQNEIGHHCACLATGFRLVLGLGLAFGETVERILEEFFYHR